MKKNIIIAVLALTNIIAVGYSQISVVTTSTNMGKWEQSANYSEGESLTLTLTGKPDFTYTVPAGLKATVRVFVYVQDK